MDGISIVLNWKEVALIESLLALKADECEELIVKFTGTPWEIYNEQLEERRLSILELKSKISRMSSDE